MRVFIKRDPEVHGGGEGPLPYFDTSTSLLESFFDSPQQLSVSLNVQIDRTGKYASFAS